MRLSRTNSASVGFQKLNSELNKDLALRNGESNDFFMQYNKVDLINHVILVFIDEQAVGCGAIKHYDDSTMEIKRMYIQAGYRGKGVATYILNELLKWARELNYEKCILETGDKMPEAIALYKKMSFQIIPNYGQYHGVQSSICFQKVL